MKNTLEWIPQVEKALLAQESQGKITAPAPFPLQALQEHLAKLFEQENLQLSLEERGWMNPHEALLGFGEAAFLLKFYLTPLNSPLFFTVSKEDLKGLFSTLAKMDPEAGFFADDPTLEGFYQFLIVECFHQIDQLGYLADLSFEIEKPTRSHEELGTEPGYVIDCKLNLNSKSFWGRLFIPALFRSAWQRHLAFSPPAFFSLEKLSKLDADVAFEIGRTEVSLADYRSAKIGDLILLDQAFFDPESKAGRITLTIGGVPIFRGKYEEGKLRLLNYPVYEEVMPMKEERKKNPKRSKRMNSYWR